MKNNLFLLILFFCSMNINAQDIQSKAYKVMLKGMLSHSVEEVGVNEAEKKEDILFVDSREFAEYQVSHLKGAVWVGYDSLDISVLKNIPKNTEIIVYCSIGYRSEKVAEKLKLEGFTNVSNLYGGIFEWKNQNKPLVNNQNEPTDSIHAFSKVWGIWLNKGEKVY